MTWPRRSISSARLANKYGTVIQALPAWNGNANSTLAASEIAALPEWSM
jgi:hypothetical protein